MKSLEYFNCYHNLIRSLPTTLSQLHNLVYLNLRLSSLTLLVYVQAIYDPPPHLHSPLILSLNCYYNIIIASNINSSLHIRVNCNPKLSSLKIYTGTLTNILTREVKSAIINFLLILCLCSSCYSSACVAFYIENYFKRTLRWTHFSL